MPNSRLPARNLGRISNLWINIPQNFIALFCGIPPILESFQQLLANGSKEQAKYFLPRPDSHIDFSAMQKEADMEIVRKANMAIACVAFVFVAAIVIGWIG